MITLRVLTTILHLVRIDLKISVRLSKKPNVDFQDDNFVELARFNDGVIKSQTKSTDYSLDFIDILAKRTFAESGNYTVRDFDVSVENALDDGVGSCLLYTSPSPRDS